MQKEEIIKENRHAVIILAKAPYTKDHLLIIPKKHRLKLKDLTKLEQKGIWDLINWGFEKLHKKHKNISIVYREGEMKEVGKSISHLHVHLVPHLQIGPYNIDGRKRKFISNKLYLRKADCFREDFE